MTSLPTGATALGLLADRARRQPESVAFRSKHLGLYCERTWSYFADEVARCAAGFAAMGIRPGDRVAILADPCEEWLVCDLAAQAVGAVSYGIYPTSPSGEVEHLIRDGSAAMVVAQSQEFLDKVLPLLDHVQTLRTLLVIDPGAQADSHPEAVTAFAAVLAAGEDRLRADQVSGVEALETLARDLDPHGTACLLYGSGATGTPRSVAVSHAAILEAAASLADHYPLLTRPALRTVAHMPLAHPLGRHATITLPLLTGLLPHFGESMETLAETFFEVAPHVLLTVPRLLEKYASRVLVGMTDTGAVKRRAYEVTSAWGRRFAERRWAGRASGVSRLLYGLLRGLVLRPILNKLGFDQLQLVICGGAHLPPAVATLWQSYGVDVVEVYGQVETGGALVTGQSSPFPRPGDVGTPMGGWEVDLGQGGEIFVRGIGRSSNLPADAAAGRQAATPGEWLATGDLGEWHAGMLRVVGRVTDRIATPGRAAADPSALEVVLRGDPYILEAFVLSGDAGHLFAFVDIDFDAVAQWARSRGVPFTGHESLAQRTEVRELVRSAVDQANAAAGAAERIQGFHVFPQALDPGEAAGVITPTRKVRRHVARERFASLIPTMVGPDLGIRPRPQQQSP